jgi:ParB-like nuclease domain
MKIADIRLGDRHRRDMGDLGALAESIRKQGLLSPIGVTPANDLVFGERRLRACRDILGWHEIEARTVNVESIVAGEYAENEIRKQFTTSERVAILEAMKRTRGGDRRSQDFQTQNFGFENNSMPSEPCTRSSDIEQHARHAGFGNEQTAREASAVVRHGVPELVAALDRGDLRINPALLIARRPAEEQRAILALEKPERAAKIAELRAKRDADDDHLTRRRRETSVRARRQITIAWSGRQNARELMNRWPRYLVEELTACLQQLLSDAKGKKPGA